MLIVKKIREIAELVGGSIRGEYTGDLTGVASLKEAMTTDISFLGNEKYAPQVLPSKASVVLVPVEYAVEPPEGRAWIACENPSQQFGKIVQIFTPPPVEYPAGIASSAVIDPTAVVPASASIGPCAVIGKGVKIGERTVIGSGCVICENAEIGEDCLLYPNVTVRERCLLGNRVILHPGVVIGADGFGYQSGILGHTKIPQVGIVQLDDDVEIGANSCVDRARFGRTWIQRGTKIDNLVQVGHNVQIGESCMIMAQVGIAGSCVMGNGIMLAGQAGLAGHLQVGDGTILLAQSGLTRDAQPCTCWMGTPAVDRSDYVRRQMHVNRLPALSQNVKELQARLMELQKRLAELEEKR